jgi:hypothetical protein
VLREEGVGSGRTQLEHGTSLFSRDLRLEQLDDQGNVGGNILANLAVLLEGAVVNHGAELVDKGLDLGLGAVLLESGLSKVDDLLADAALIEGDGRSDLLDLLSLGRRGRGRAELQESADFRWSQLRINELNKERNVRSDLVAHGSELLEGAVVKSGAEGVDGILNLLLGTVALEESLSEGDDLLADGALIKSLNLRLGGLNRLDSLGRAQLQQRAHLIRGGLRLDELNEEGDVGGDLVADRSELLQGAVIDDSAELVDKGLNLLFSAVLLESTLGKANDFLADSALVNSDTSGHLANNMDRRRGADLQE